MWNIHAGDDSIDVQDLKSHTNNSSKRYNHTLNDAFPNPRPNIIDFVMGFKKLDDIKKGIIKEQAHEDLTFPDIPEEYNYLIPMEFNRIFV